MKRPRPVSFREACRFIKAPLVSGLIVAILIHLVFKPNDNAHAPELGLIQDTDNHPSPHSYADAVSRASASVVNIYTLREQGNVDQSPYSLLGRLRSGGAPRVTPSTGSGVIVSGDGYIITNQHVIKWARAIRVALQDGREAEPKLIGFSEDDDMAVLKIDLDNLSPITIGDPENIRIGDVVLAIGNPFGVGQTVTQGIISATRRKGLNISHYENFLQTDAAINPGNSGGALVDADGRLLGINIGDLRQTQYGEAAGIGFAIPADRAMQALLDIVEHGRVVRGWLGASAVDLNTQTIEDLGLMSDTDGVLIADIYQNGPADIAGLLPGDVITAINGNKVTSMSGAIQEFANLRPDDIIVIDIIRNQRTLRLEAVLSTAPQSNQAR